MTNLRLDPRIETHQYSVSIGSVPSGDDHVTNDLSEAQDFAETVTLRDYDAICIIWENETGDAIEIYYRGASYSP